MTQKVNLDDFSKDEIIQTLNEVRHPFEIAVFSTGNYFNIAGIIRTAHAFLVRKIYLIDVECPKDAFYEKGTMAMHRYENIVQMTNAEFVAMIKNEKRSIVSYERRPGVISTDTSWDYKYPNEPILVFGSEKTGVPDNILELSKDIVSIPMFGLGNDLSIGHAASIAMYDWIIKNYRQ